MDGITINRGAFISSVTHQPFRPPKGWTWATGGETYARGFDLDGRLPAYALSAGAGRTVGYDHDSRVSSLKDASASQTIGYDANSRVSSYTGPFGNGNQSEKYDNDGNRTVLTTGKTASTYTIDPQNNQITQRKAAGVMVAYGYDGDGNTQTEGTLGFNYDSRSWLIQAAGSESYLWDGLNERISKAGSAQAVRYAWAAREHNWAVGSWASTARQAPRTWRPSCSTADYR